MKYTNNLFTPQEKKPVTIGDLAAGLYNDFHKLMTTSKVAALLIPTLLVVSGAYIIYKQVWPTIYQTLQESSGYFKDNGTALVAGDYIAAQQQYSNPGSKYFADLKNAGQQENLLFNDPKSNSYKGTFSLSIPSLDINSIKVTANVDSSIESVYKADLLDGLAHFSGTGLPLTDNSSYNTVIYGHSAAGDYWERTHAPSTAFSVLSDIRYGSEIILNVAGKDYKYKFIKGRIVDANDLTILDGIKGQKTLTLFTCYPRGNNNKRFVATAKLEDSTSN